MQSEEEYLGGFTSANLKKGMIAGYGIYATNRRIIGIKSRKGVVGRLLLGGITVGILDKLGAKITRDESAKMIEELDKKKDFEISKEQVSQIEIKKPSFMSRGHLTITLKSGEDVKVLVGGKKEFEQTRDLMLAFLPEAVRLRE